jgi:membrane associated rhomboid family serine protease
MPETLELFNSPNGREPHMDDPEKFEAPVNPIPPVIVLLVLVVVLVEATFSLASAGIIGGARGIGWRNMGISDYAFVPQVMTLLIEGQYSGLDITRRFVTYPFIHGSFTQALFGGALLLALGKFVGDIFRAIPVLIIFFGSTIFGAIVFGLTAPAGSPLLSVFTPVYGLIGAYTYIIWLHLGQTGANQIQAFRLIGILLAIQLVFGVLFGAGQMWIAEIAGFVAGFALSIVVAPGGWTALLRKTRQRRS